MKMNHIDGNKISPMAIIACVSAKHKIGKTNTFKLNECFEEEGQIHDSIEESSNLEQTEEIEEKKEIGIEDIEQTEEIEEKEEIQYVKYMGKAVDKYHDNKLTHTAKFDENFFDSVKTNHVDCSKKSPNSLLATIFATQSNNSQNPLGKTIKDEEEQIITDSDDKIDDEVQNDYIYSENIAESLQTNQPIKENINYELEKTSGSDSTTNNSEEGKTKDISGPCFQVVLLSTDDNGEIGIEDSGKVDTQKDDVKCVNESGPKIIEIPSGILASFLGVLNSNTLGIPLDSLVKIIKVSEADEENCEYKNADEECCESYEEKDDNEECCESYEEKDDNKECYESYGEKDDNKENYENYEEKDDNEECYENYEEKDDSEECYESYEEKDDNEECYESYEEKDDNEECYENYAEKDDNKECYESYGEKDDNEENYENYEGKNDNEKCYESYEEKCSDEYCYECCGDKSVDEHYYECYEDKSADGYYYEFYEDKGTDEYYYECCEDNSAYEY